MNFIKANKKVSAALMQVAVMGASFSASAATAAYYASRRGTYSRERSFLFDPSNLGLPKKSQQPYQAIGQAMVNKGSTSFPGNLHITQSAVGELVVVDQNIKSYQQFYKLIKPGQALVEIPKDVDGLSFLLKELSKHQGLKAVHLFSHATEGEILLGSQKVNIEQLKKQTDFSKVINQAVAVGGDLLLYGCELGKGEKGDELLQLIKSSTHVDVAASNNLTGNAVFKGDWELEVRKGDIEAKPLADSVAMKDFTEVLQNIVFQKSTWTVVDAGAADQWGGTAGTKNAKISQNVNGVSKTLLIDGEYSSTGMIAQGDLYFGRSEKSFTISFTDGSKFKPLSIELYVYQGDPATITTNNGGSMNVNLLNADAVGYTTQIFDLSSLPAGATSLTIRNNAWQPFLVNRNNGFMGQIRKITFANIGVLPVNLISYTAKTNGNHALLNWQTASEQHNKSFEVYRSSNGVDFIKIGEKAGVGQAASYSFTDSSPLNGLNYYKLVQVDLDGTATELEVKSVNFGLSGATTIYPNPTESQAKVVFEAGKYQDLVLSSVDGKVLQKYKIAIADTEKLMDLSAYPNGIYVVKLQGRSDNFTTKLVKQ